MRVALAFAAVLALAGCGGGNSADDAQCVTATVAGTTGQVCDAKQPPPANCTTNPEACR